MNKFTPFGKSIMEWRSHHGFYTPDSLSIVVGTMRLGKYDPTSTNPPGAVTIHGRDLLLGKLMLVVTEVSELNQATDDLNFREEIADIAIRILDITAALDIDMDRWLEQTPFPVALGIVRHLSAAAECVRKDDLAGMSIALARAFSPERGQAQDDGSHVGRRGLQLGRCPCPMSIRVV
jgi:hypothetical protein